jgi:hypothetical protein
MWLLEWIGGSRGEPPEPRTYEEIRADVERRESEHIARLNQVEASLLTLTAEAGLEDLRRRMEQISRD